MKSPATSEIHELGITVLGKCQRCGQYLVMTDLSIPNHSLPNGEHCDGSRYSHVSKQYKIENDNQALRLAQVIAQDNSVCLGGRQSHSMACADGLYCAEERRLRSQALANYFISHS